MSTSFHDTMRQALHTTYRSPLAPSRYTNLSPPLPPPSPPYTTTDKPIVISFLFECGHKMTQEIPPPQNSSSSSNTFPRPMKGQCCHCSQTEKEAKDRHERNIAGLRVRAEHIRGKVVKWSKPGYGDEDLYETFKGILRGIVGEWGEKIERGAKGSEYQHGKNVGIAFGKLEKEIEEMLEKVGVMVMAGKDGLKETASGEQIDCGDHERWVRRVVDGRKRRELEEIRERMKELRYKMEDLKEYREVLEQVEDEFAELGRWANCLFRGEDYVEERGSPDEGDTNDSDSD